VVSVMKRTIKFPDAQTCMTAATYNLYRMRLLYI